MVGLLVSSGLPTLAMGFGAFILCAETCLHFDSLASLSSWVNWPVHDWIAGGGLLVAGLISRKDWRRGRAYQAAAWAFMTSLLMAASISTWADWSEGVASEDEWISTGGWVMLLVALLALSTAALAATLLKRADPYSD